MVKWLHWNDLTEKEQEQAKNSYISLREDEKSEDDDINAESVKGCRFERMEDGYIYVDL